MNNDLLKEFIIRVIIIIIAMFGIWIGVQK